MYKYKIGQIVYIVSNNKNVQEGRIIRIGGGLYTIKINHGINCGPSATRLKEHRLFTSRKDASYYMKRINKVMYRQ